MDRRTRRGRAPQGLAEFCKQQHPRVLGLLSLYLGDAHVAEELAQESLIRLCHHWRKVEAMEHPAAWLQRVAINAANSHFRRRAAERRAKARLGSDSAQPRQDDASSRVVLRQVISRLPRRQKAVLVLHYYEDMTFAQIAELLEWPENTVKSHARRGLQNLRSSTDLIDLREALDAV